MTATPFTVTFFDHTSARFKREQQLTAAELVELIETSSAERKDLLPWLKLARFGELRTEKGKSLRHDANVLWINGCEADYDGEQIPFDEAVATIKKAGVEAIVYTSPSHLPDKPRWRIVGPFSEQQQPERRVQMVARLNGLFYGTLAAESFTLSQSYYYGHVVDADGNIIAIKENGAGTNEVFPSEYRVELVDGMPLDQCNELDHGAIGKSGRTKSEGGNSFDEETTADLQELVGLIVRGEVLHHSVGRIAGKLARLGTPLDGAEALVEAAFTAAKAPRYDGRLAECLEFVRWVYTKEEQKKKSEAPAIIISPTKWQDRPVPALQWAVPDWIPQGRVFGLYGSGGEGKTTLAQQLLTSCAIDHDWLGLNVTPMRSLGVFCEDDADDLHRRQSCINANYHCQFSDLTNMALLPRLGRDNMLIHFDKGVARLTAFWHEIKQAALDFGAQLVVIDTIADTYGGSEIDRGQSRQYVQIALGG
jgi:hypothetical protein